MTGGPASRPAWPAYALAAATCVAFQALVLALGLTPALQGRLHDVDGYTHLVRAHELHDNGDWYDITIDRSNAPFGTPMHWTRPFDLLLLAGGYAGAPFAGFHAALFWWGVFLPALLQVACALTLVWAAAPLLDATQRLFLGPAFVFQLSVSAYSMAGRPDHHLLLLLGFVCTLGLTLRLLLQPFDRGRALLAGAVAGVGLWLSIELLLPLIAVCGGLALAWARSGGDRARRGLWHAVGATGAVAAALMLERPPSEWLVVEWDRLSCICLLAPLLAWMFWAGVRALEMRGPSALATRMRWTLLLVAVAAAAGLGMAVFARGFFGSSMYRDPQTQLFFSTITENQPLLTRDAESWGQCLLALGSVTIALPCLLVLLRRAPGAGRDSARDGARDAWAFVALALGIGTAAALALSRLAPYAEILATLPLAWLMGVTLQALGRLRNVAARVLLRAAAALAILIGPMAVGAAAGAAANPAGAAAEDSAPICSMELLIDLLVRPEALGGAPRTILTHPTYGPEILYRTGHLVVGSPDHRNIEGIRDCVAFFRTTDEALARSIVTRRGVDLVIVCGPWLALEAAQSGPTSIAARLKGSDFPAWLRAAALPPGAAGDFLILDVERP